MERSRLEGINNTQFIKENLLAERATILNNIPKLILKIL